MFITILRHEKSLNIVKEFLREWGSNMIPILIDAKENPESVEEGFSILDSSKDNHNIHAIIAGTKVYDVQAEHSRLLPFVKRLRALYPITPIILTHLTDMDEEIRQELVLLDPVIVVENDNLGRNGMDKLGPVLKKFL